MERDFKLFSDDVTKHQYFYHLTFVLRSMSFTHQSNCLSYLLSYMNFRFGNLKIDTKWTFSDLITAWPWPHLKVIFWGQQWHFSIHYLGYVLLHTIKHWEIFSVDRMAWRPSHSWWAVLNLCTIVLSVSIHNVNTFKARLKTVCLVNYHSTLDFIWSERCSP